MHVARFGNWISIDLFVLSLFWYHTVHRKFAVSSREPNTVGTLAKNNWLRSLLNWSHDYIKIDRHFLVTIDEHYPTVGVTDILT